MSARVTSRAYGGYYGSRAHLETMARRTKFPNDIRRAMPTRVHPREGLSRLVRFMSVLSAMRPSPLGITLWMACGEPPKLRLIWRSKLLNFRTFCSISGERCFNEKISVVFSGGLHRWRFVRRGLSLNNTSAGQTMQHRAAGKCAVVLVLSAHRWPKMLVRGQAHAGEIVVALASDASATGAQRSRARSAWEWLQSSRCSSVDPRQFRWIRSALALALSGSNRQLEAGASPKQKPPLGWDQRRPFTHYSRGMSLAIDQTVPNDS